MKTIDRNIFKLISNTITVDEFESYLYQEDVIAQIDSNELVFDLVDINYKKQDFLKEVKNVVQKHFNELDFLLIELRFNCLKIIEAESISQIEDIISKYSNLYRESDFNDETFGYFYSISNHLDFIDDEYMIYNQDQLFSNVKSFARKYLDVYDSKPKIEELLNVGESISYGGDLPYFSEEEVIDFVASEKLDFLSNKKIRKTYTNIGFSDSQINEFIKKVEEASMSKLVMRILIYTVIGIPFFYVGIKSLEQKQIIGITVIIGFTGAIMLISSIIHLIQLAYLFFKRKK